MKLNFDDVKENKIAMDGLQALTIKGAKEQVSKNGTNMLVLDMEDTEGGFVRDYICLEGAGAFRAQQLFNALEISAEDAAEMQSTELIGLEVDAEVEIEDYEGQDRARIKKYC